MRRGDGETDDSIARSQTVSVKVTVLVSVIIHESAHAFGIRTDQGFGPVMSVIPKHLSAAWSENMILFVPAKLPSMGSK